MSKIIEIKHRINKYRTLDCNDIMDICDPETQEAVRELTGRKTVSHNDLKNLRILGCTIIDLDQQLKEMFA